MLQHVRGGLLSALRDGPLRRLVNNWCTVAAGAWCGIGDRQHLHHCADCHPGCNRGCSHPLSRAGYNAYGAPGQSRFFPLLHTGSVPGSAIALAVILCRVWPCTLQAMCLGRFGPAKGDVQKTLLVHCWSLPNGSSCLVLSAGFVECRQCLWTALLRI
jgi:hypothetical protein